MTGNASEASEISQSLVELFKHNAWANQCLFEACERLSDAELDATIVGTFGSIRDTLVHIVGAQERYVVALAGSGEVVQTRERSPYAGLAELRNGARTSGEALIELVARVQSGSTVSTTWRGETYTLPGWLLCVQAINHATEHRSHVATILTQMGIQPPSMDGWSYHETQFNGDWSQLWSS